MYCKRNQSQRTRRGFTPETTLCAAHVPMSQNTFTSSQHHETFLLRSSVRDESESKSRLSPTAPVLSHLNQVQSRWNLQSYKTCPSPVIWVQSTWCCFKFQVINQSLESSEVSPGPVQGRSNDSGTESLVATRRKVQVMNQVPQNKSDSPVSVKESESGGSQ